MKLSAIAAVAENYVIGRDNDLPWKLPADLRWFVEKTRGKTVVFGRRTYESTGYLKSRRNIVITSQTDYDSDCDLVVHSIDEALQAGAEDEEVMILGGRTIYQELMPRIDRLYLTVVHARPEGDTRFPPVDASQWVVASEEHRPADERNVHDMTFLILDRETYGPAQGDPDLLPLQFRSRS
jgi:dihydrofolate reductase